MVRICAPKFWFRKIKTMGVKLILAGAFVLGASYLIASKVRKHTIGFRNAARYRGKLRLPTTMKPLSYNLELTPNLKNCKFDGKLTILLQIQEPTRDIVLNAADLTINTKSIYLRTRSPRQVVSTMFPTAVHISASSLEESLNWGRFRDWGFVFETTQPVLWPSDVRFASEEEIMIITFSHKLKPGQALLGLEFQGILNNQMRGFYVSSYDLNGEEKRLAVTQFQPADARRCFPCWDEPVFKAVFKLTLHVPMKYVALSNMPALETSMFGSKRMTVFFDESPKMSSYLAAVVVGELDYIEDTTVDGKRVRVYTQVGTTELGRFALKVAVATLPFFSNYFGLSYPLPKLDMVAIPDFASGAMENFGLVTFQENVLLLDETNATANNKCKVAVVVAHEVAHQWFGNLVTMEWWTHLWLKEGFATWVSFMAIDHLFPEWDAWTQFNKRTVAAYQLDGLEESHPIEVEVGHVREIDEIFDPISYVKGAAIIHMLQTYLGAEKFQTKRSALCEEGVEGAVHYILHSNSSLMKEIIKLRQAINKKGLVAYIQKFKYKNATTEDLWTALSEVSGEPVWDLMNSWTSQMGYPVINVKSNGAGLDIKQSQFLSSGIEGSGEWVIPITVCSGSYQVFSMLLMRGKESSMSLDATPSDVGEAFDDDNRIQKKGHTGNWVKLNVKQTGFYRVQYDDELTRCLRVAIMSGCLEATDRFGVLDDAYALCVACKQPIKALLSLMDVYKTETNYYIIKLLINISHAVYQLINDTHPEASGDTAHFISKLLQTAAKRLGWDAIPGETHLDTMLREELLKALIVLKNEDLICQGIFRFNEYLKNSNTPLLPASIRPAAYRAVMQRVRTSNKSGFDDLLELYRDTELSQEKKHILGAIASSPDPSIVRESLNFSLSFEVRNPDVVFVLEGISAEGREAAWTWLKENWELIWGRFGDSVLIIHFIKNIVSKFSSFNKADEIEAFFEENSHPEIDRTVRQSIEQIRITAQWVDHVCKEEAAAELVRQLAAQEI